MPHSKQIFFDPDRKRWRRLRLLIDISVILVTLLIALFVVSITRGSPVPAPALPQVKRPYHALKPEQKRKTPRRANTHRKTKRPASEVVLNSDEGVRAAFYVQWDAASFSSLKEYYPQIDWLFPEWMHVLTADGRLQGVTEFNTLFDVMDKQGKPQPVDEKVMSFLKGEKAHIEVFPLVNNFDPVENKWDPDVTAKFMADAAARERFRHELMSFLATDQYKGITLDIEAFPESSRDDYRQLVTELYNDLQAKGMKLFVAVPVNDKDFDYAAIASVSDGLILMNYDQHYPGGEPGAVAGQDWFVKNLQDALKAIPKEKIICSVANYGYDWAMKKGQKPGTPPENNHTVTVQEAWLEASESDTDINFDDDAMNPHFAYLDGDIRHDVWFVDGVTALNQMRAAHALGIDTFALWRLGSEDRSLWAVWDKPFEAGATDKLSIVPPGEDVDDEGYGEIIRIQSRPSAGERTITVDPETHLVSDEVFKQVPLPYVVDMYGGTSEKKVALTFDDGPDPTWTPKILDVLKAHGAKATFFLIGAEVEKFPGIAKRIFKEGHEIGNHTFTHPDVSNISKRYFEVELNLTEKLFESKLGVKPVLMRPPYAIDEAPDTADQVRPLEWSQDLGYITVGEKIDPNDWRDNPRASAQEIADNVMKNLPPCAPNNMVKCGNIILFHDGGGDRSQTVKALALVLDGLKERGYQVVPVSELMGKTRAEVMPPISTNERWSAWVDSLNFSLFGFLQFFIIFVFFVGDVLMSGRLLLVGVLAIYDRLRQGNASFDPSYRPDVAVLVPAYNEEKVIERTVRSVLESDYPNLRVIVIDDGSKDATLEVTRAAFKAEIAAGRVTVLTKPNSGKADALDCGLEQVTEEIFVGIDADTIIAPDAILQLVPHFSNPKVAAMAGNAKVGNRVNLWTRWQALEYITSQNFERRALNTMNAVSVVPGAIGAWRTAAVRAAGGYHRDTVAEDADLTMALLQAGNHVNYEDRALAYTEAPTTANGLMRQRFRWSFGIMQAVWKHRAAVKQKGALGWVAIPNMVIFQILLPLVSPFIDIMFAVGAATYFVDKFRHPESANPADFHKLVVYFTLFMVIDFIASTIAFTLERQQPGGKRDFLLLAHVWLQRFAYRQLFSLVLLKTLKRAMEGGGFSWDKLERTASVKQPVAIPRQREAQ